MDGGTAEAGDPGDDGNAPVTVLLGEQASKETAAALIEGGNDTIDGAVILSGVTVREVTTQGTGTHMRQPLLIRHDVSP